MCWTLCIESEYVYEVKTMDGKKFQRLKFHESITSEMEQEEAQLAVRT